MSANGFTVFYTGREPEGVPEDFAGKKITVLCDTGRHDKRSYCRLLDIDGIRYVLRLEFNADESNCMENGLIQDMFDATRPYRIHHMPGAMENCMLHFWPYIVKDYEAGEKRGTLPKPIGPLDYNRWESRKLQLKTVDGSVRVVEHDRALDNRCEAIQNPFAEEVRCFHTSEVEIINELTNTVFKVKIQDNYYCLKLLRWERRFLEEITNLRKIRHPNVVELLGLVELEKGKVVGYLMPFILGKTLSFQTAATKSEKALWKESIASAIAYLHENGLVWGDNNLQNIMMDSSTKNPVLIDFEHSRRHNVESAHLDVQTLKGFVSFIDNIREIE